MHTFLLLLAAITAHAEAIPSAPNCGSSCSEPMREILEEFGQAGAIGTENLPAVFSGECYHLTSDYRPDQAHHGFALLEAKAGQFYMGGLFSFFANENPYASLTLEEARKNCPRRFEESHRLTVTPDLAYADMNRAHPENPWRYWLKQNGGSFLLLAQWGSYHQVYCRYTKNP